MTTPDTTRAPRRRDPKDTVLQCLYILLFAIAGVTCLTGILFLRSGLRIAEPASTISVVRTSDSGAPPAALSGERGPVRVRLVSQARAPSGKATRQ
ncbi:MAG: hypothetical protein ACJ787_12210 [Myxococcales bacterium]